MCCCDDHLFFFFFFFSSRRRHTRFDCDWSSDVCSSDLGYAVLAVNYRGSAGRGQKFSRAIFADWGNYEVQDLLAGVDHVIKMGVADPDRLGIGGWSYGGIRSEEHTSELQSQSNLVCRLLLE